MTILHRRATLTITKEGVYDCALSSERPGADRHGDIIRQAGIDRTNYEANPIVLFDHQASKPIATMKNLRIEGGQLRGTIYLAPKSTSAFIAEIWALMSAGVLRSVSIGFRPLSSKPLPDGTGILYESCELCEVSVVSVPANVDAKILLEAKALGASSITIKKLFRDHTRQAARAAKHYSASEKAALLAKAKALLKSSKPKSDDGLPPLPLSPAQKARKEQDKYNRALHVRAKAIVAKHKAEKAEAKRLDLWAKQDQPQKPHDYIGEWQGETYFTWRGQKIPVPTWRGKKRY